MWKTLWKTMWIKLWGKIRGRIIPSPIIIDITRALEAVLQSHFNEIGIQYVVGV